jgi:hypothetical protein
MFKNIFILMFFLNISLFGNSLKDEILNDDFSSNGFTGFIEYKNNKYLITVGISNIKDNSIQSKLNALKGSKILAQSKLTKFIHNIKITSMNELTTKTIVTINDKNITRVIKDEYIEIIKEQSNGLLKNVINIGKWKIENEYFYALGVKI